MKKLKFDQSSAVVVILFSLVYAYLGSLIEVNFFNGLVGPHHWVYILSGFLGFFALLLFVNSTDFQPSHAEWKDWLFRLPFVIGTLLYVEALVYVGFLPAMIALMTMTGVLFGATKTKAFVSAVIMSVLCYLLFDTVLDISLGRGLWLKW